MGRYVRQPLAVQSKTIGDVRRFLTSCRYVSDQELFGQRDYWQPPEDFETRRKGDCEDFALWTWRQLLNLGYDARFVGGSAGRYGEGHAWVEYFRDGKCFLLEPLYSSVGSTMPRLLTLRYQPRISVSWDGKTLRYFAHQKPNRRLELQLLAWLITEYLVFGSSFWVRNAFRLPLILWNVVRRYVFQPKNWRFGKRREQ